MIAVSRVISGTTLFFAALLLAFPPSPAQASSCDLEEAETVDAGIAHYRESVCAQKVLQSSAGLFESGLRAEARGDSRTLCNAAHSALMKLDFYRYGEWRTGHRNIAEKIDASFNEKLARFETTTCPKKPSLYRHLATQGNSWAMFRLAQSYLNGTGVPQDDGEALAWFQQAAGQGYIPAAVALGMMHSDSRAFAPDYPVAAKWFGQAAVEGDAEAQYRLGMLQRQGLGLGKNPQQAAEWLRKAATQGHSAAKTALSDMYRSDEVKKPFWGL